MRNLSGEGHCWRKRRAYEISPLRRDNKTRDRGSGFGCGFERGLKRTSADARHSPRSAREKRKVARRTARGSRLTSITWCEHAPRTRADDLRTKPRGGVAYRVWVVCVCVFETSAHPQPQGRSDELAPAHKEYFSRSAAAGWQWVKDQLTRLAS